MMNPRQRRKFSTLSHTNHTVHLHPITITQNQPIFLIIATHLLLRTQYSTKSHCQSLKVQLIYLDMTNPIYTTTSLQQAHTLWFTSRLLTIRESSAHNHNPYNIHTINI